MPIRIEELLSFCGVAWQCRKVRSRLASNSKWRALERLQHLPTVRTGRRNWRARTFAGQGPTDGLASGRSGEMPHAHSRFDRYSNEPRGRPYEQNAE